MGLRGLVDMLADLRDDRRAEGDVGYEMAIPRGANSQLVQQQGRKSGIDSGSFGGFLHDVNVKPVGALLYGP